MWSNCNDNVSVYGWRSHLSKILFSEICNFIRKEEKNLFSFSMQFICLIRSRKYYIIYVPKNIHFVQLHCYQATFLNVPWVYNTAFCNYVTSSLPSSNLALWHWQTVLPWTMVTCDKLTSWVSLWIIFCLLVINKMAFFGVIIKPVLVIFKSLFCYNENKPVKTMQGSNITDWNEYMLCIICIIGCFRWHWCFYISHLYSYWIITAHLLNKKVILRTYT